MDLWFKMNLLNLGDSFILIKNLYFNLLRSFFISYAT